MSQQQFDDVLLNQAVTFLQQHRGEHLAGHRRELLSRCVVHLRQRHDISVQRAEDITIRAYGEVESTGVREYVDLSRTTSNMITLRDPGTGVMRVLTVADLLRFIGPAHPPRLKLATTH